jgi:hypothetical protein
MPGLLRGVARVAVVSGTATAVSNRVSRRQASRWSQQEAAQQQYAEPPPAAAPPPAAPAMEDEMAEIQQLAQMKEQGILTEEEFAAKKKQILGI